MKFKIVPVSPFSYAVKAKRHWYSRWVEIWDGWPVTISFGQFTRFRSIDDAKRVVAHLQEEDKIKCPSPIKRALTGLYDKIDKEMDQFKDADFRSYGSGRCTAYLCVLADLRELIEKSK